MNELCILLTKTVLGVVLCRISHDIPVTDADNMCAPFDNDSCRESFCACHVSCFGTFPFSWNFDRILARYEAKKIQQNLQLLYFLASNSANKPSFQNPTKRLFACNAP